MNSVKVAATVLLLASLAAAQSPVKVPAGVVLPVLLLKRIDAMKSRPGQEIKTRLMEDVELPAGNRVRAGALITGHIVDVKHQLQGSAVVMTFDRLETKKYSLPLRTNLRAMASWADTRSAQDPTTSDQGPEWDWTTVRVGGEVQYGSGENGVAQLRPYPGSKCRGNLAADLPAPALWVFSSDACGLYGFGDLTLAHAGRTDPLGQIVLESRRKLVIDAGSALLLRVE